MSFLYMTQFFEWLSMLLIICGQHRKKLEEILYDHDNLSSCKKKEIWLRRFMVCFAVTFGGLSIYPLTLWYIQAYMNVFKYKLSNYVEMGIFGFYALINLVTCLILTLRMWQWHRFEFKRNIKQFSLYMILLQVFFMTQLYCMSINSPYLWVEVPLNKYESDVCDRSDYGTPMQIVIYFGAMVPSLVCLIILKFKKDDDLLNSISKLDWLLKVSIFQKYKDKSIGHRFSLTTFVKVGDKADTSSGRNTIRLRDGRGDTIYSADLNRPFSAETSDSKLQKIDTYVSEAEDLNNSYTDNECE